MNQPGSDLPSLDHTVEKEKEAEFNDNNNNNNDNRDQNGSKTQWNLSNNRKEGVDCVLLERVWDTERDKLQYDTFESISFANWMFSGTMWMIVLLKVFSQIEYVSWVEVVFFYGLYLCEVFNCTLFQQLIKVITDSNQLSHFLLPLLDFQPEIYISINQPSQANIIPQLSQKAAAASSSADNKEPDKTSVSQNKIQDIEAAMPLNEQQQNQQPDIDAVQASGKKNQQELNIEMARSPAISAEIGGILQEINKEQNQPGVQIVDSNIFIPVSTKNSIVSLQEILQKCSAFRLQISVLCHFDQTSKWTEIRKQYFEQIEQDPSLRFQEFCKNRAFSRISCLYMSQKHSKIVVLVYLVFSFAGLSLLFRFAFNRIVPSLKLSLDKFII